MDGQREEAVVHENQLVALRQEIARLTDELADFRALEFQRNRIFNKKRKL